MAGEKEKTQKHKHNKKESMTKEPHFKPSSDVKGIRFGSQFVVKSFTVRRATPLELVGLLDFPPLQQGQNSGNGLQFPSTIAYMPTRFTILAHHAWHTLTLGLGTKKSKVLIFIFESQALKESVDREWPATIPLGDVNKKLIRGLNECEIARFKFRKGSLTFYLYAVRRIGITGFSRADDLRIILETVVGLKDFLDHTAMLALPNQRSIGFASPATPAAMAH